MQTFIDTATQQIWQFENDVMVTTDSVGVCSMTTAHNVVLDVPTTLQPYTIPVPTNAEIAALAAALALASYQQSAQTALTATDTTFARIQEAITLGLVPATDVSVVTWIEYRKALRAEIKATAVGTLAVKPTTYPTGT